MSSPVAALNPNLLDVSTFLSDLSSTLQGRSLSDLPHMTFPSGTFILMTLPVNSPQDPFQQKAATNQDRPGTETGRSQKSRRHPGAETPGPSETSASTDGTVHQDLSQQSRHQQDEGKAYSMLCDIIDGYSGLNSDQGGTPHSTQPTPDAGHTVTKPSRSGKKPAADASVKRKTRCVAIKADQLRCTYKARQGFETCGIPAHRRQDPEHESSDEAYSDSDA